MSTLSLTVHGDYLARGARVVATFYSLGAEDNVEVGAPLSEPIDVQLGDGAYLVEVVFPSGERIRRSLAVPHPPDLVLYPSPSPNEWLGLQRLYVSHARLRTRGDAPTRSPDVYELDAWPAAWRGTGLVDAVDNQEALEVKPGQRLQPTHQKPGLCLYEVARSDRWRAPTVVVQLPDRVLAMPLPPGTQLAVNLERRTISSVSLDPARAAIVAYIAAGQLGRVVALGAAPDLSPESIYEALGQGNEADFEILRGRQRLVEGQLERASEHFVRAFDCGMPAFSFGLRLLMEGLLSLPDVDGLERITADVRRWAGWTDPREGMTTLSLGLRVSMQNKAPPLPPMAATS